MKLAMRIDSGFVWLLRFMAVVTLLLVLAVAYVLVDGSHEAFSAFGFSFLTGREWDPISGTYGALPFVVGSLATAFLALFISIPFSMSIALYLGEFFGKGKISALFTSLVELLAGIPSVIYGFWALFYLVPIVRELQTLLDMPPLGVGILSASLILAIMIIPFSASIAREVIRMVPAGLKEAAYALGATRFEVIRDVIFPVGKSGIFAGIMLSLGRALGETMAVTMVIGNSNYMPKGLFDPANTIASLLANEFAEADRSLYVSSLVELGLVLFVLTGLINFAGKYIIRRLSK
ncbi:MAG TPA: phosphate ABC transporter permease subunit PstC [Fibrobacteraceae bacterium]|nr:phosphate ABC transporter permease subunit PstC [Fibrobacteraceae bacterium]